MEQQLQLLQLKSTEILIFASNKNKAECLGREPKFIVKEFLLSGFRK